MWWAWPSLELDEIQIWYRLTLLFCPFCQMIKGQRNQREYKKWTKYNNFHILFSTKTLLILNMITITACFHNFFLIVLHNFFDEHFIRARAIVKLKKKEICYVQPMVKLCLQGKLNCMMVKTLRSCWPFPLGAVNLEKPCWVDANWAGKHNKTLCEPYLGTGPFHYNFYFIIFVQLWQK